MAGPVSRPRRDRLGHHTESPRAKQVGARSRSPWLKQSEPDQELTSNTSRRASSSWFCFHEKLDEGSRGPVQLRTSSAPGAISPRHSLNNVSGTAISARRPCHDYRRRRRQSLDPDLGKLQQQQPPPPGVDAPAPAWPTGKGSPRHRVGTFPRRPPGLQPRSTYRARGLPTGDSPSDPAPNSGCDPEERSRSQHIITRHPLDLGESTALLDCAGFVDTGALIMP